MVLGKVGPHDSIFIIDGDETTKSINIRNACLSMIHSYMSSIDKLAIREKIFNLFILDEIKEAREVLYTSCDPKTPYRYRGPNKATASVRDKLNDAFEGIYSKLVKLDAEDNLPKFSVPSEDLIKLLNAKDGDHSTCDTKFEKVSSEISEIKKTFHSFVKVVTSNNTPDFAKAATGSFHPNSRDRLISTASKRTASDFSDNDENILTETDTDLAFEFPRLQRKKIAKRARVKTPTKEPKSFSEATKTAPKPKPPSTWGTVKSSSASFKSAVSDIFMHNCDISVLPSDIIDWFKLKEIGVRNVEKLSHEQATRKSFKISPNSKEEYDKILSGEFLPEGIAVRQFIPRRWNPDRKASISGMQNQFRSSSSANVAKPSAIEAAAMQLDNIINENASDNDATVNSITNG